MSKSEKVRNGPSSTRRGILRPVDLPDEYREIGILHEHRDNNDVFNYPPVPMPRGAGKVDPQEGAKTKHLADPFNISVEQNNMQITEVSGTYYPFWQYNQDSSLHTGATAFTQIPTSKNQSLERLQRQHKPSVIRRNLHGTRNPSWRPRMDYDREEF